MVIGTRGDAHDANAPIEMAMSSGCGEDKIKPCGTGMTTGVVWKYLVTYCRSDYSSYLVFGDFGDTQETVHLFRNNSPGQYAWRCTGRSVIAAGRGATIMLHN